MAFNFAFLLFLLSTVDSLDAVDQDEFNCAGLTYESDVKGLTITCEQYPNIQSKPIPCFKDLWWKYLAYEFSGQQLVYDPNPFDVLDLNVCRKKCQCVIVVATRYITCLPRGRPPTWSKEFNEKQRNSFYCRGMTLPQELLDHSDQILFNLHFHSLDVTRDGAPVLLPDIVLALDNVEIESFEVIFFHFGDESKGAWPPIESIDNLFTLPRLSNITSFFIAMASSNRKPRWPNMETTFSNISTNLMFLYLSDLNMTAIPRPSFPGNLRTLVCDRCTCLTEAPNWAKGSSKLLLLHISQAPVTFPLLDLPPLESLLHFSFCQTPLKRLPDNFSISKLYPNLENLDLSNLALRVVPADIVQGLIHLRRLDLSQNCLAPLPSFSGLTELILLNLDGISPVISNLYGLQRACAYGPCTNLRVERGDFADLVDLEILTMSYYGNVEINEEAFANLTKLKNFAVNCANLTSMPTSLRYTCNLRSLSANLNPFNNVIMSEPSTWPVPAFVPKYLKNLNFLTLDKSNLTRLPPTMLIFNASKEANIFRTIAWTIMNNPVASNACEMYKFETGYKIESSASANSSSNTANCHQEFTNMIKIAQDSLRNSTDYCAASTAALTACSRFWWLVVLAIVTVSLVGPL